MITIQHNGEVYIPDIVDEIEWTTERTGSPGELTFNMMNECPVEEGDLVQFIDDNEWKVFKGYVFSYTKKSEGTTEVTCYDLLRYFKNSDSMVYENLTVTTLVARICKDFGFPKYTLADTKYVIKSRVEEDKTMFDIIYNAMDLTLVETGKMYVLYDNFGTITMHELKDVQMSLCVDNDSMESYEYSSSIDDETYNYIKVVNDDKDKGVREVFIASDKENMEKWGTLMKVEKLSDGENGKVKAEGMLALYNCPTKKLKLNGVIGDSRIRAGFMIYVNIPELNLKNMMLIEKCSHTYASGSHTMDLTLRGGDIRDT